MSAPSVTSAAASEEGVDSRWWYWIAALPVYIAISIPIGIVAALIAIAPAVFGSTQPGADPIGSIPFVLLLAAFVLVSLIGVVLAVAFPIALYVDAMAVAEGGFEWDPDPVLYAILGLLNFVASPLIGVVVALYYLYQRHVHVGVP